ncbi:MAG: type IX secretion system membrane protein PorP/SprF [Bacteroidia bacterium]|nr:type IX secretion system membrane protein PorP/SprF [Bacteroidia bacterium]
MKNIVILCLLLVFTGDLLKAQQDAQYNLYQFNQMVINPAYAGARNGLSATGSVRQQWAGIDGAPLTSCFSAHSPIADKNLGVGVTILTDKLGPKNMFGFYGNAAYMLNFSKEWKLSLGLGAGYNRYQFNSEEIKMLVTENPNVFVQDQVSNSLDICSGAYLKSNDFFFGISATHLNSPSVAQYQINNGSITYKLKTHLFVTAGKSFKFSETLIFAPTVLVKFVSGQVNTDLNLNFLLYKKLWLGAFYRSDFGPGFLIQYYITSTIRAAYSYDTGIQDARRLGGSHEIMIGFDMGPKKVKIVNPRFL